MSRENVAVVRERYRQVNAGGFAAIADYFAPEFTMDAPQGVESSQAHDKAGLQEWFRKMDEIWEGLPSIQSRSPRLMPNGCSPSCEPLAVAKAAGWRSTRR